MRKRTIALAMAAILVPLAVQANPTTPDMEQAAKWARLAAEPKPGPCPTEVEVLPYIWIEPATGMEYTALRLHCPGRDDLDDEPNVDNTNSQATSSG